MRKNISITLVFLITAAAVGCAKHQFLPVFTPPVPTIFTANTLNHTADTVNVGDTIWLNATGTVYDTTKNIYVFLSSTYTAGGVSQVFSFGTAASPVKLNRVIGAATNGVYAWSALITMTGATNVAVKTKLSISGTFQYQDSFSSQLPSSLTVSDAGVKNKTVYVN
jgi:hypothetical protein